MRCTDVVGLVYIADDTGLLVNGTGVQTHRLLLRNFISSIHPTLPVSFGRDTKSRWSLLPGVYASRSISSHAGKWTKICHGFTNSREGHSEINCQFWYTFPREVLIYPSIYNNNITLIERHISRKYLFIRGAVTLNVINAKMSL